MHSKTIALLALALFGYALIPAVQGREGQEGPDDMPVVRRDAAPMPAPTAPPAANQGEIIGVLLTALPPDLLSLALTNQGAISSVIASDFAVGRTDDWFKSLPTPVQSYLVEEGKQGAPSAPSGSGPSTPISTPVATTPSLAPPLASSSSAHFTNFTSSSSASRTTTTMKSSSVMSTESLLSGSALRTSSVESSSTLASSTSGAESTSAARNTSTSTAGAMSFPTAAAGAIGAGALALLGPFAL